MRAHHCIVLRQVFMAAVAFAVLAISAVAQQSFHGDPAIHGVPPSVTSFGFGGHPGFHGVPPSVTSLNFGRTPGQFHRPPFTRHPHHSRFANPFYGSIYYVPYAVPYDDSDYYVMSPGIDDTMEEEYARPGPTIFDSHGVSGREYPRLHADDGYRSELAPEATAGRTASEPQPEPPQNQPTTLLVFKDGRQMEVENYVIAGTTLYDLSDGRSKKVALAELDLPATVKQNDDRGVDFKIPAAKTN